MSGRTLCFPSYRSYRSYRWETKRALHPDAKHQQTTPPTSRCCNATRCFTHDRSAPPLPLHFSSKSVMMRPLNNQTGEPIDEKQRQQTQGKRARGRRTRTNAKRRRTARLASMTISDLPPPFDSCVSTAPVREPSAHRAAGTGYSRWRRTTAAAAVQVIHGLHPSHFARTAT